MENQRNIVLHKYLLGQWDLEQSLVRRLWALELVNYSFVAPDLIFRATVHAIVTPPLSFYNFILLHFLSFLVFLFVYLLFNYSFVALDLPGNSARNCNPTPLSLPFHLARNCNTLSFYHHWFLPWPLFRDDNVYHTEALCNTSCILRHNFTLTFQCPGVWPVSTWLTKRSQHQQP